MIILNYIILYYIHQIKHITSIYLLHVILVFRNILKTKTKIKNKIKKLSRMMILITCLKDIEMNEKI